MGKNLIIHDASEIIDQTKLWAADYVLAYFIKKEFFTVQKDVDGAFGGFSNKRLTAKEVAAFIKKADIEIESIIPEVLELKEFKKVEKVEKVKKTKKK